MAEKLVRASFTYDMQIHSVSVLQVKVVKRHLSARIAAVCKFGNDTKNYLSYLGLYVLRIISLMGGCGAVHRIIPNLAYDPFKFLRT